MRVSEEEEGNLGDAAAATEGARARPGSRVIL